MPNQGAGPPPDDFPSPPPDTSDQIGLDLSGQTPVSPSIDFPGSLSLNDRSTGDSDPDAPVDSSDSLSPQSNNSPYSLLGGDDSASPYHLLDPSETDLSGPLSDITREFSGDALGYYSTGSAISILIFGTDKPSDILLDTAGIPHASDEAYWAGLTGAAVGGVVGFLIAGPVGADELGMAGYEIAKQGYEIWEDAETRGAAIDSLAHNLDTFGQGTPGPTPTPSPGPTPDMMIDPEWRLK